MHFPELFRRCGALALFAALALPATADDEFGLWGDIAGEHNFSKQFSTTFSVGARANDNLGSVSRIDFGVGAKYKLNKNLSFGAGYTFIEQHRLRRVKTKAETYSAIDSDGNVYTESEVYGYNVSESFWRPKHRVYIEAQGKVDVDRFTFALRERYQFTRFGKKTYNQYKYRDDAAESADYYFDGSDTYYLSSTDVDTANARSTHYLRSRIGVDYDIAHCKVDPFASFEFFNNLSDGFHLDKWRLTIGADWKICKGHTLTAAYVYTHGSEGDDDPNLHAVSIGYKFKF